MHHRALPHWLAAWALLGALLWFLAAGTHLARGLFALGRRCFAPGAAPQEALSAAAWLLTGQLALLLGLVLGAGLAGGLLLRRLRRPAGQALAARSGSFLLVIPLLLSGAVFFGAGLGALERSPPGGPGLLAETALSLLRLALLLGMGMAALLGGIDLIRSLRGQSRTDSAT